MIKEAKYNYNKEESKKQLQFIQKPEKRLHRTKSANYQLSIKRALYYLLS